MPKVAEKRKYLFTLNRVDLDKVEQLYGNTTSNPISDTIPINATKISDLELKKSPEIVSFIDESKIIKKCTVSRIDFLSNKKYKCYWDRNYLPPNIKPIGAPIRYCPNKAIKDYQSEINQDRYSISESITGRRTENLIENKDSRITIQKNNYYVTDGIFCSFNCLFAFLRSAEAKNAMYMDSYYLTLQMYKEMNDIQDEDYEILPAPDWRMLQEFGGTLTIEQFRDGFNKSEHICHGVIDCRSIGRIYENRLKF